MWVTCWQMKCEMGLPMTSKARRRLQQAAVWRPVSLLELSSVWIGGWPAWRLQVWASTQKAERPVNTAWDWSDRSDWDGELGPDVFCHDMIKAMKPLMQRAELIRLEQMANALRLQSERWARLVNDMFHLVNQMMLYCFSSRGTPGSELHFQVTKPPNCLQGWRRIYENVFHQTLISSYCCWSPATWDFCINMLWNENYP